MYESTMRMPTDYVTMNDNELEFDAGGLADAWFFGFLGQLGVCVVLGVIGFCASIPSLFMVGVIGGTLCCMAILNTPADSA